MSAVQVKKPMRVTFFSSGVMEEGVDQGGMTLCMSGGVPLCMSDRSCCVALGTNTVIVCPLNCRAAV